MINIWEHKDVYSWNNAKYNSADSVYFTNSSSQNRSSLLLRSFRKYFTLFWTELMQRKLFMHLFWPTCFSLKAPRELFMSRHVFNTNPFANVSSLFTNLLLVPLDLVMIVTKFLAAFWLRNNSFVLQSWKYQFSLTISLLGLTVVSILAIVLFFFSFLQHLHEPDIDLRRLNFQYLKDKQTSRWRFPKLTVVYRPVTKIFSSYFKYSFYSNMQEKLRFTARVIYLGNHKILNAVCYLWEIPL